MEEIWKDIDGTNGKYAISTTGDVKNVKSGRILRKEVSQRGYHRVILSINGKVIHRRIHRLVAMAYIPNPNGFPQVDHINGCKTDNRVENLRWVDNITNNNLFKSETPHKRPVIVTTQTGSVQMYDSMMSASKSIGVSRYGVMATCYGHQNTTGGVKVELL